MSCGCADVCNCFLSDTDTVSITGNGTSATPYQATVIPGCGLENTPLGVQVMVDPDSPIPVSCSVDGLVVGPAPVCVMDSESIGLTVDEDGCITAYVHVDPAADNLLTASGAGLLADLETTDSATVVFSGDGTVGSPLTADVVTAGGGIAAWEPGMEMGWAGSVAPAGWLLEDGAFVPTATYPALFAVTGHAYNGGVDPGGGNFKLPDCKGRQRMGPDGGAGRLTANNTVGAVGGAEAHALSIAELASHDHPESTAGADTGGDSGTGWTIQPVAASGTTEVAAQHGHIHGQSVTGTTTGATGSGDPHTNLDPYQVGWTIIKY